MKYLLTISLIFIWTSLYAQTQDDIPFKGDFGGYGVYKLLRSDSTGDLMIPNSDTNIIVFISKKWSDYKMFDRMNNLLSEGYLGEKKYTDYFKRFGKWTAYYITGNPKVVGYYYADEPVGLWKYFYPNGQLKLTYSLAQIQTDSFSITCKVGLYEEYYENGQLKINGFYKTVIDSTTIKKYDLLTGDVRDTPVRAPVSKPFGIWTFYYENGNINKREDHGD